MALCFARVSLFSKEAIRDWYPAEYRKLPSTGSGIVNLLRSCGSAKVPVECGYLSEAFSQQTYQGCKSPVKCGFSFNFLASSRTSLELGAGFELGSRSIVGARAV